MSRSGKALIEKGSASTLAFRVSDKIRPEDKIRSTAHQPLVQGTGLPAENPDGSYALKLTNHSPQHSGTTFKRMPSVVGIGDRTPQLRVPWDFRFVDRAADCPPRCTFH